MRKLYLPLLGLMITTTIWVTPKVKAAPGSSSNVENSTSGGGHYLVAGSLDVQFAFSAGLYTDGHVAGAFHDRTNDGLGLVDFDADVTCLAVDRNLARAWIGGVITANRSTSPDFTDPIHQPGHDIW